MTPSPASDLSQLEASLWSAADNLRANSKLTSSDYFMPVLGIIFLRHAANRFDAATVQIEADQRSGAMPPRPVLPADYLRRRALWLPENARYDVIMDRAAVSGVDLPTLINDAMQAIEDSFEPLEGALPKDYASTFANEPRALEDLMRLFNGDQIKRATGDVFGRIYEYFLAEFSVQKAHDNGEFFTPASIVQTIVNVIEPNHGTVFDPACGSGGMFVQTSHFIERAGGDTAREVVFYGQEKNRDTINIARMNLAVHGLEGEIADAITYYQDEHTLAGKCDFVMANPPFNVDLVDAERIKPDTRLPFGLPGTNKEKKVPNANYLWISYFYSYLNDTGRAGFVMSSQASSAGHGEKDVRRKIVETGHVDVMISIRSGFFYTRSVPCELWFFDRGKPAERQDKVLMLDARGIFRKVTRTINDFSPEQLRNLSSIVWLYRGQTDRFLSLVSEYLQSLGDAGDSIPAALQAFEAALAELRPHLDRMAATVRAHATLEEEKKRAVAEAAAALSEAVSTFETDRACLEIELGDFRRDFGLPDTNEAQHAARRAYDPVADSIRGVVKQIDHVAKLAVRLADLGAGLRGDEQIDAAYDRRAAARLLRRLDDHRAAAVERLRHAVYLHRQIGWLQDRFPDAVLTDVPGLVKLVDRAEVSAADWSLSPGRYVEPAPHEDAEDFDLEATLRDIHGELAELNDEAGALAAKIQENIETLIF